MSALPSYNRIAGIFPIAGVTLLVGGVGCGKTYSTMKALIQANEKPYWFNMDHVNLSPDFSDTDFNMCVDNVDITDFIQSQNPQVPVDMKVLVIDTYTQLNILIEDPVAIATGLDRIARKGVAVIVLAHPEAYQNKTTVVFKENRFLMGNCHEYCELVHLPPKAGTKLKPSTKDNYQLTLVKGRMYQGINPIDNWMR